MDEIKDNKRSGVVRRLEHELRRGDHGAAGTAFMTVRELAAGFGVSPVTAQRCVDDLKAAGLLYRDGKRLKVGAAAVLSGGGKRRIALLVTESHNQFFGQLMSCVEKCGAARGLDVVCAGSDYDVEAERRQLEMLAGAGADGFLICPAHESASVANVSGLRRPFVLVGRELIDFKADAAKVGNFNAGRKIARHLLRIGCGAFAYAGISHNHFDERRAGFAAQLREAGCTLSASGVLDTEDDISPESLTRICSRSGGRRTGLFCYHDLAAARVIRCAKIAGLRIPEQLAVAGFDDLPLAAELYPSLTSMSYPIMELAENAVGLLLRRMVDPDAGFTTESVEAEVVPRESTFAGQSSNKKR
ncbi:MAG: substrate-binding domain-containing protein [Victivallaceae bacterium]|nr:substrate-binding domain-containing protein [Victivallaceae bacterium]